MQVLKNIIVSVLLILCVNSLFAQDPLARDKAEEAISKEQYAEAFDLINRQVEHFLLQNRPDSVNEYLFIAGKTAMLKENFEQADSYMLNLVKRIRAISNAASILRQTCLEVGEFYGYAGRHQKAYNSNLEALSYHDQDPNATLGGKGKIESNLSAYAQRMGNIGLAQLHGRKAVAYIEAEPNPDFEQLYFAYNTAGVHHWFSSRMDSAAHFFLKALDALTKTDSTPENLYYRRAILQNNLCGIYSFEGSTTKAIRVAKECINNIRQYLQTAQPGRRKDDALGFQFSATDNLAGIYKELGNYRQARELLQYSYEQKKAKLNADDPAIFYSEILLGQLYYALREYDRAELLLNKGLEKIAKADGDYLYWQADASNTLALLYDHKKNIAKAEEYYRMAESLYEQASHGDYDNTYLEFLRNAALFYAQNGKPKIALEKAGKTYAYIRKTQGQESLLVFYQLLNLSEVHLESGNYSQAGTYASQGLSVVESIARKSDNLLDSVKIELQKPQAILLRTKSVYARPGEKNEQQLRALLNELNQARDILERRRSVLNDPDDLLLMMSNNQELLEFIKKITLDLYKLTGREEFAYDLIGLHESGIYNRIRSRLDRSEDIRFAHIPEAIHEEENRIKTAISQAFEGEGTHDEKMQRYMRATADWENYLDRIRTRYAAYYRMRYETIFRPVHEIQRELEEGVSVVRYFFVGKELMVYVADRNSGKFLTLGSPELAEQISLISENSFESGSVASALQMLYQQLWKPVSPYVKHERVIVIPDGILFNLNFEVLTPERISRYEQLAGESLLSKHIMSYRYSLFLLSPDRRAQSRQKNFVAFVPGFTDEVKNAYRRAKKDTLEADNAYYSLLPQPFTVSLANKARRLLQGDAFMNTESTLRAFREHAGGTKIIHIGTHAESDNQYPEYSRLIFARNPGEPEEENSLYLFDIYTCDLSSDLTVLTACESGKPGYKDGEGMISLAHAFNYAGSESIITGLWKIDEQSSTQLMDFFYDNLLNGMTREEALRYAKIRYLETARGRTLAPQYWAGLVLMGETGTVNIESSNSRIWLYVVILIVLIAGIMGARKIFRTSAT